MRHVRPDKPGMDRRSRDQRIAPSRRSFRDARESKSAIVIVLARRQVSDSRADFRVESHLATWVPILIND